MVHFSGASHGFVLVKVFYLHFAFSMVLTVWMQTADLGRFLLFVLSGFHMLLCYFCVTGQRIVVGYESSRLY